MAMVDVDDSSLPADLHTKSVGLVWALAVIWRLRGCSIVQKIVIKILIEVVIEIVIEIDRRGSTVQKIVIENLYSLVEVTCCVIDNDAKLASQIERFA